MVLQYTSSIFHLLKILSFYLKIYNIKITLALSLLNNVVACYVQFCLKVLNSLLRVLQISTVFCLIP